MDSNRALMIAKLNDAKNELLRQSKLEKELNDSQRIEAARYREACILAANYFTSNRIDEIYDKSVSILRSKDFSPADLKEKFKDIATIKVEDINFLYKREEEIASFEEQNITAPASDRGAGIIRGLLISFAETLNGGDANDD